VEILKKLIFLFLIIIFIASTCTQIDNNNNSISQNTTNNNLYEVSRNSPYPVQNFIYLDTVIIGSPVEENSQIIPMIEVVNSASGIAIKHEGTKIYAFTAGHWCAADIGQYNLMSIVMSAYMPEYNFRVIRRVSYLDKFYEIESASFNIEKDLCVITFSSPKARKIKNIRIARSAPRIGDSVYAVSAPMGFYSHSIRTIFEGYFAGCEPNTINCFYTIPGTNGSSGSGVLNSRGELVSILNLSVRGFNNITGGSKIEDIRDMYDQYIR